MSKSYLFDTRADQQYLEGIQNMDAHAFSMLYKKYFQSLTLASEKYIKNLDTAQEIVQDVFLKLWEKPFELDNNSSLKSYLYRCVINASINSLKREKSIEQHHLRIAEDITESYLDTLQEEQELNILIYNEIELLPLQCKKVFKMSRFEGLKYREIAIELNISEKTVENHMMKALKILRERLFDHEEVSNSYKLKLLTISFLFCSTVFSQ